MARVERYTTNEPVPIEQAQLIDPGAFPFSTAGAEALKVIGGVLGELGRRKIEMQDRIGISNINAAMEDAVLEYQKEIVNKPLEEHAAILQKHRNNAMALANQQRLSPDARELAENKVGIWGDSFADMGELATLKAIERDALIRVTADYEKALVEGNEIDIAEAEEAVIKQYAISYTPAEAGLMVEKIEQRAIKQIEANANFAKAEKARIQREQKEAHAEAQKQAASQFLVRMWDKDLTDPQEVTDALKNDLISDTDAKYIRNAMLSKEPPELDLNTYADALSKINDYRNAKVKREDVVSFITANFKKIDPATGKSLIAELISVEDPEDPLNTTPAKIYATLLKSLYDGDDISAFEYDQLHTQYKKWFKANPDATPKQRAEFYGELTKDATGRLWKKLFSVWKSSPFGKPYRMVTGEKEKLPFPEHPDAFQLGDSWYVIRDGKRYRITE